jgi:hypothetical protein
VDHLQRQRQQQQLAKRVIAGTDANSGACQARMQTQVHVRHEPPSITALAGALPTSWC